MTASTHKSSHSVSFCRDPVVLCNPPFHQAQAVTDHIAWQMFKQAKDTLKEGGELRIIGNRHLDYHDKLNRPRLSRV